MMVDDDHDDNINKSYYPADMVFMYAYFFKKCMLPTADRLFSLCRSGIWIRNKRQGFLKFIASYFSPCLYQI